MFRGVEIVPGVQLGVIDANDADRDLLVGTLTARYASATASKSVGGSPYVYRHDRVTTLAQRDESITRTTKLEADDIGDVEVSARYQISRGLPGQPIRSRTLASNRRPERAPTMWATTSSARDEPYDGLDPGLPKS